MKMYLGKLFHKKIKIFIKEFIIVVKEETKPEKGKGQRVVMDLVNHLSAGNRITTDTFLTSNELANKLLDKNITLGATLRKTYIG